MIDCISIFHKRKTHLLGLVFFLLSLFSLKAQEHFDARIISDSSRVMLGNKLSVKILITGVYFLKLDDIMSMDTLGNFRILEKKIVDSAGFPDAPITLEYICVNFEEGLKNLGPLSLTFEDYVYESNHILIDVYVPEESRPEDNNIFDIKDILDIITESWIWIWILIAVAIALIIGYIIYQKRSKDIEVKVEKIKIPSDAKALVALNDVEKERLWAKGNPKKYCSDLSEILRSFIEETSNYHAMEITTDELINMVKNDKKYKFSEDLKNALWQMDMVKFAKFAFEQEDYEKQLKYIRSYVLVIQNVNNIINENEENNNI